MTYTYDDGGKMAGEVAVDAAYDHGFRQAIALVTGATAEVHQRTTGFGSLWHHEGSA